MQPLFTRPDAFARKGMVTLLAIMEELFPLRAAHRRDLPRACRDLSAELTTDRAALGRPYWTSPRLTAAYLRYFLPWNLVRLCALLPTLDLGREDDLPAAPLVLDLGSGPLTVPMALWLARPDLRERPVTVVCADSVPHVLDLGRRLFEELRRALAPESPWTVRTLRASLWSAPRQLNGRPWLLTMGNMLNEVDNRGRQQARHRLSDPTSDAFSEAVGPAGILDDLLEDAAHLLVPGGRLLAIEPGTRQGGRLIAGLRASALSMFPSEQMDEDEESDALSPAFHPLAPCAHAGPCPMLAARGGFWCHFNTPPQDVPPALKDLSRLAGMDKTSVSLSFLLLRRTETGKVRPEPAAGRGGRNARHTEGRGKGAGRSTSNRQTRSETARIVSDAFPLPGRDGRARYACTARGLALVADSARLPSGCLCEVELTGQKDGKSGATMALLPGGTSPEHPGGHAGTREAPHTRRHGKAGGSEQSRPDRKGHKTGGIQRKNAAKQTRGRPERKEKIDR